MIPVWASVDIRTQGMRRIRLWLPLLLIWLLLAPLILLAAVVLMIACPMVRVNPLAALAGLGDLLAEFTGTHVEVETPGASVLVRVL